METAETAECPICFDAAPLHTWGTELPDGAGCTHALCLLCALRHLHNELSVPEQRLSYPTPLCPQPFLCDACLAARPAADSGVRTLGEGAAGRARARVLHHARARALALALPALAGTGLVPVNCPGEGCAAILTLEPRGEGGVGTVGRCDACDLEQFSTLSNYFEGPTCFFLP
jgi:hypothetical protein